MTPARACAIVFGLLLASCRRDMADQAHHEPLEANQFFADGAASRPFPSHTVPRGDLQDDEHFLKGRVKGQFVDTFPGPITMKELKRGRERFDIYCAVCHGSAGDGDGMIVQRGFPAPPSLHIDRLRDAPAGYFFEVITKGYGVMYPYASRVETGDRWAIVAYIRALQLSQRASLADADTAQRRLLEEASK